MDTSKSSELSISIISEEDDGAAVAHQSPKSPCRVKAHTISKSTFSIDKILGTTKEPLVQDTPQDEAKSINNNNNDDDAEAAKKSQHSPCISTSSSSSASSSSSFYSSSIFNSSSTSSDASSKSHQEAIGLPIVLNAPKSE